MSRSGASVCVAVLVMVCSARAADPGRARYSADPERLFWLVHLSDTHIGSEWYDEDTRFYWALQEALGYIQPELVVVTGDLVDGSIAGIPASGQSEEEWRRYRSLVDQAGLPPEFYLDLPGNHDIYGADMGYYLSWSLNGSTFGKTTRAQLLDYPFGKYLLYGCATPGDSAPRFVDTAEFSASELDEMQAELSSAADAALIFVFGHHPPDGPENASAARDIWRANGALYFHGHSHIYEEYLFDGLLVRQVNSLGKAQRENLALLAADNDWTVYEVTSYEDPWPFIVVTAPADARLENGQINPYAYGVGVGCPQAPVRALVFDRQLEPRVSFRVAGGEPVAMERHPTRPMLYLGQWDTSRLSPGEIELAVSVYGSAERERTITVRLEERECPEPYLPADGSDGGDGESADAGDAGLEDAGQPDDGGGEDADEIVPGEAAEPDGGREGEEEARSESDGLAGAASGCGCRAFAAGRPGLPLLAAVLFFLRRRRVRQPVMSRDIVTTFRSGRESMVRVRQRLARP